MFPEEALKREINDYCRRLNIKEVKTLDFNHKIAFPMSDYEAGEFLDQPRLIRELSGQLAYYHNGRAGNRFVPYKL